MEEFRKKKSAIDSFRFHIHKKVLKRRFNETKDNTIKGVPLMINLLLIKT